MKPSTSKSLTDKLRTLYSSHDTLPKLIEDEKIKAQSLEEYYVKLQILLSEDDEAGKAALRDKVVGEKKPVEIEKIFKAIDTEKKIRELLKKELPNKEYQNDNIVELLNEEKNEKKKFDILRRNLPNKSESEIKNIAESINRIQADVGKVLLLGSAGIGKTTLMHYLSYKWGKGELWNDKFDYVFRVKLKELLSNWTVRYGTNIDDDILSCFIHYCLDSKDIKLEDIKNIQDKDRILLLLDGYDEVAFLSYSNRDYRDIMDSVFQYKNIVMTSRPNALVEEMSNRFERKVENTGWDSEGVEQYVNKNFEYDKELGVQLKSFLDTHSQIKEICVVPINTALICLVWNDKDIRDKFQKNSDEDFNISRLYSEITDWLNNRHLAKTQHKYKNKTEANNHLKNKMSFLEQIAYESLVVTGKLVERKLVEDKKDTLDIDEVIEQGLLKREGINYQFIHLTFQEFLAALRLKNQLLDNHTKNEKAAFIGEHRNDPKYLMTLKFLAGIVNNDDNQELIEIFWEAITCNVDGILELGIERKIILLMHLLAQSKINGKFDGRIPNLTQIQNLIDEVVLKDTTSWEQHIIDSSYLSENIIKTVNEKLRKSKTDFQELKASVGIITSLVNRHEWGSKTKVYERLIGLLKIENTKLCKAVLQKLAQILDETVNEEVVRKSLKMIISLLGKEVDKYVNITLAHIITVTPDLGKEVLNQLQKKNKFLITKSIAEIITTIPNHIALIFLNELPTNLNYKIKLAVACSLALIIKTMPIQEANTTLKELFINPNRKIKHAAAMILPEITEAIPVLASEVITFLKKEITDPSSEDNLKHIAISSITRIAKILPNLIQETFTILKIVITNPNNEYNTKIEAIKSIAMIVKAKPNLAQEAFTFLKTIITNPNTKYDLKLKAIESIIKVIEAKASLAQKAFIFFREIITNPNKEYKVKSKTIECIVEIVREKPSLVQEIFTFLKMLIINSAVNYNLKLKIINSIVEIVEITPSLAYEAFTFLNAESTITKSIAKRVKIKPIKKTLPFIVDVKTDEYIKADAFESITNIVKAKPSLAQEIFTLSKKIIINSDANYYVKYASIKSILTIAIEVPSLLTEIFSFLSSVIINSNVELSIKSDVALNIVKIVKAKPSLIKKAYIVLRNLLDVEYNKHIIYAAGTSLVELIESIPFDKRYYKYVRELFKIIKLTTNEELNKDLHTKATLTLHKITHHLTQEYEKGKNPEVIEWFNRCFNELPNISETRIFLKEICQSY